MSLPILLLTLQEPSHHINGFALQAMSWRQDVITCSQQEARQHLQELRQTLMLASGTELLSRFEVGLLQNCAFLLRKVTCSMLSAIVARSWQGSILIANPPRKEDSSIHLKKEC